MIRLLTPEDAPAFVELRRFMLLDTPWAFGASPGDDRASREETVRERFAASGQAAAGGFVDGRLVSTAIMVRDSAIKRAHVATVYSVYTHPDARRRGLGRGVCGLLLETARGWDGVEMVQLSVSERAPGARAMYEGLGYRVWGTEPACLRIDGESADEHHMWLRL